MSVLVNISGLSWQYLYNKKTQILLDKVIIYYTIRARNLPVQNIPSYDQSSVLPLAIEMTTKIAYNNRENTHFISFYSLFFITGKSATRKCLFLLHRKRADIWAPRSAQTHAFLMQIQQTKIEISFLYFFSRTRSK